MFYIDNAFARDKQLGAISINFHKKFKVSRDKLPEYNREELER